MKINTEPVKTKNHIELTSSKGNQNKWLIGDMWYKEDGLGYEALAEVLVSRLLKKTNVNHFVEYDFELLEKGSQIANGCRSVDFMTQDDDKIVSIERLFQMYRGESAAKAILKYPETEERVRYIVEHVEEFTGLRTFGQYLKQMITVDTLFLNEDRHFHNIAVIQKKDGSYRECPIFDNGAALCSDIKGDYPLSFSIEECYRQIEAKPFSMDFDEQLDAVDVLYGEYRFRAKFTMEDVETVLQELKGIYDEKILERVHEIMRIQMRKFSYLFEK